MSRSHKKLLPIGSNMNDAAYPFRGEYKLEDVMNHGHSGVRKNAPTSLALKITGSNLVIEKLQTAKGADLACELAVDRGVPRAVALGGAAAQSLAVPGDGRDYHVTAVVKGEQGKHYCHMTFNGSEGQRHVLLRAPTEGPADAVMLFVDGKLVRPVGGLYRLPLRSADCSLVLNLPDQFRFPPAGSGAAGQQSSIAEGPSHLSPFLPQIAAPPSPLAGDGAGVPAADAATGTTKQPSPAAWSSHGQQPVNFILETVPGTAAKAVLQCTGTSQSFDLDENGPAVAIPANSGPYRLCLPKQAPVPAPVPASPMSLSGAPVPHPVPVPVATGAQPVAPAAPAPVASSPPTLELESRPYISPNGVYCYTVIASAPGTTVQYTVQLTAENGSVASGAGHATLELPHRRDQRVQVTVTEAPPVGSAAAGRVVLRQQQYVPSQQLPTVAVSLQEEPGTGAMVVRGAAGSRVQGAGAAAGASSARVERGAGSQVVSIEQPNADGTVSSVSLNVEGRPPLPAPPAAVAPTVVTPVMTPVATPPSQTIAGAGSPAQAPDLLGPWVSALAGVLKAPSLEEARRGIAAVAAPPGVPAADTITGFVREQLFRPSPSFTFSTTPGGLTGVGCGGGLTVKAAVNGQPETEVPAGGTVEVPHGGSVTLSAVQPRTAPGGRPGVAVASLRLTNQCGGATPHSTPAPTAPFSMYGASSPASDGEAALIARLVDSLQRNGLDARRVADELDAVPVHSLSPAGQRLVPLLVSCLRRAIAEAAAGGGSSSSPASGGRPDEIFFTCGNGYLANVYTASPQYQLLAAVDGQPAAPMQQRGRVPPNPSETLSAEGQPHFVELTAKDPLSGAVVRQVRVVVMGAEKTHAPQYHTPAPPPLQPQQSQQPDGGSPPVHRVGGLDVSPTAPPESGAEHNSSGTGGGSGVHPYASPSAPAYGATTEQPRGAVGGAGGSMSYLDVAMQPVGQDVQLRCDTAAGCRIVCSVDGIGGDTGLASFVTRMHASRHHRVEFSVLDGYGHVVFQQKLDVPAMSSTSWGVALQDSGLSLDPDGATATTLSLDRAPERAVQGNYVSIDTNTPHLLVLRRYLNGVHGVLAGELALRVPAFISPADLEALARLYRSYLNKSLDAGGMRHSLGDLRNQSRSPIVRDLIDALIEAISTPQATAAGPRSGSGMGKVYFRLTGSD